MLLLLVACEVQPTEPPAPESPCPEISMDSLGGDWIRVSGSQADHTYRLRVFEDGGAWKGWYTGGGFKKVHMDGEKRAEDLMLTEVPVGAKAESYAAGQEAITRLYFQPHPPKCSIRVVEVRLSLVEGKEKEQQIGAGYVEWLPFPAEHTFTFRPCDDQAFVDKAAKDWKVAKKELEAGVNPVAPLGEAVPVGAWSVAEEDGAADCTYDMDAYIDDRPVEGQTPIAAGEVKDGRRQWYAELRAPWSGNHHFELYRHRTCAGGDRELVAVSCIEAILH